MASIFTKIINGEIPSYKVAESDKFYAFLDIFPIKRGHTLVVPKQEVDYIFDLDDDTYVEYFAFAKRVAAAIEKTISCQRIGLAVIGLEVPHAHIHLIPLDHFKDMNFANPKLKFSDEEFKELAAAIASNFE